MRGTLRVRAVAPILESCASATAVPAYDKKCKRIAVAQLGQQGHHIGNNVRCIIAWILEASTACEMNPLIFVNFDATLMFKKAA